MEITVGAQFKKVGTEDIVTVIKHDTVRGTVVVKFPSGRSIPMSTGSLMKAEKWELVFPPYLGEDDVTEEASVATDAVTEEVIAEETETENKTEKPKKEKKKKPIVKMRKSKAVNQIDDIITKAYKTNAEWGILDFNKGNSSWILYDANENPQMHIVYNRKDKLLDIEMTEELANRLNGTEFDNLGTIDAKFIEDKLTKLLNTIVEKVNTKESEEQANG